MLAFRVARMVGCGKHVLYSAEEVARDDRLVNAVMQLPQPVELRSALADNSCARLFGSGASKSRLSSGEVRQPLLLRSRECRERADILLLSPMLVIALVFIGLATFFSAVFR